MNQSEQINELAAALSAAQASMDHAQADSENTAFKRQGGVFRYPSLRAVIEAYKPALTANGLAVVQTFEPSSPDTLTLTTALLHSSGQWISGTCTFPVERPGPQGYASASTYARRYSLMALVGLAPDDDDDGNAASQPPRSERQDRPPAAVRAREALRAAEQPLPVASAEDANWIPLRNEAVTLYKQLGLPAEADALWECVSELVARRCRHWSDLTPRELEAVVTALRERVAAGAPA